MNRQALFFGSLVVLMIALVTWWFFDTFEYYREIKDVGFSSRAEQNPYLAAERFLDKYNIKVKSLPSILALKKLPNTSEVLFIPTGRYDMSTDRLQQIMSWVNKGGHLIVRARRITAGEKNSEDELFSKLGVEGYRKKQKGFTQHYNADVVDVKINSSIENKKVEFNADTWMKNVGKLEPSWQVDGENGSKLLEYKLGDGYISLLSDLRFMDNTHIGKHDHAAFLYTLVHIDDNTRGMLIIRNDDMPSLIGLIAQHAPATLLALGILLLAWLWYVTRRFGPIQRPEGKARRSLREHIIAVGHFQWRNRNRNELFASARTALLEQIAQSRPPWAGLSEQVLSARLSKLAGLPADRILAMLQAGRVERENDFAQSIEIISLIRKNL